MNFLHKEEKKKKKMKKKKRKNYNMNKHVRKKLQQSAVPNQHPVTVEPLIKAHSHDTAFQTTFYLTFRAVLYRGSTVLIWPKEKESE